MSELKLLEVRDLQVRFPARSGGWTDEQVLAVAGVDLQVAAGETVGLVGESGSGKSTLARAIAHLVPATGSVRLLDQEWLELPPSTLRAQRRHLQLVFQDPLASLNPRMSIGEAIEEPLKVFQPSLDAAARQAAVRAMLVSVGLSAADATRYPAQFSGGQCQRIGIARAMIVKPDLLICDEPVSALDVSIQGQIINLLLDLQRSAGTAMIFISHNLGIVRHVAHRIYVLYRGQIVETAGSDALFDRPRHPYTRELLAAVPHLQASASTSPAGAARAALKAATSPVPAVALEADGAAGSGCAYRRRCPFAVAACAATRPELASAGPGHLAACLRLAEI